MATIAALVRPVLIGFFSWRWLLGVLILIILFIPIRRYTLPGNLPFQLEPYRCCRPVRARLVPSLLVDPPRAFRRTGFEARSC